jgi:hypothetical protein
VRSFHASLIYLLIVLIGKRSEHFKDIPLLLELGKPRIYPFQIWVDIGAVILSSWFFGWKLYPRIAAWIAAAPSFFRYFLRALGSLAIGFILMFAILILEIPIYLIQFSAPHKGYQAPAAGAVAAAFHGRVVVIALHALTAVISAPAHVRYIGKESNHLEDVDARLVHCEQSVYTEYVDKMRDEWQTTILPALKDLPPSLLIRESELSERALRDIRAGRSRPHPKNQERLAAIVRRFWVSTSTVPDTG